MTVNLILKAIPEYNPTMQYTHGDLFYVPEKNQVFMNDKFIGTAMHIPGDVRCDDPRVTYIVRARGTGNGAVVTDPMSCGWNKIKNVVFNDPATIVFWQDGTKTVVKCAEGESYDPEKGLMAAIAKKTLGNLGNYYNQIKNWLPEEEKEEANNGT